MEYINGKFSRLLNAGDLQDQIDELKEITNELETNTQEKLVSGENLRTVDDISLLGSGNIPFKTIEGQRLTGDGNIKLKTIEGINLVGHGNINLKEIDGIDIIGEGSINFKKVNNQSIIGEGNIVNNNLTLRVSDNPLEDLVYNGINAIGTSIVTLDTPQTIIGEKTFKNASLIFTTSNDFEVGKIEYNTDDNYLDLYSTYSTRFYVGEENPVAFALKKFETTAAVYPLEDSSLDLGSFGNRWKDIYLTGQLRNGTNMYYGLVLPDTISYTENKIIATTENVADEARRAEEAETALNVRIDDLDLAEVGANGNYIKFVSQEDGQLSAIAQEFDLILDEATDDNIPTTKAVKDYVDNYSEVITTENEEAVRVENDTITVVTRDTDQTITGQKTFLNNNIIFEDPVPVGGFSNGTTTINDGTRIKISGINSELSFTNNQYEHFKIFDNGETAFTFIYGPDSSTNYTLNLPAKTGTIAVDEEVLHRTGDLSETVTGNKFFIDNALNIKNAASDTGYYTITADEATHNLTIKNHMSGVFGIKLSDLAGDTTGTPHIYSHLDIAPNEPLSLYINRGGVSNTYKSYLDFPDNKGTSSTHAVLAVDEELVHKTGDLPELVTGKKDFEDGIGIGNSNNYPIDITANGNWSIKFSPRISPTGYNTTYSLMTGKIIYKTIAPDLSDSYLQLPSGKGDVEHYKVLAIDEEVVHTAGREDIYGVKKFYDGIDFQNNGKIYAPTMNPAEISIINGASSAPLTVTFGNTEATSKYGSFSLSNYGENIILQKAAGTDFLGTAYLLFPNKGTSQVPNTIAVTEEVVHNTGNEPVGGVKTFTANKIIIGQTEITETQLQKLLALLDTLEAKDIQEE